MKQTPNYALPYPECAPPLLADASDIIQLKNLADATDTAVQGLYDQASAVLVHPQAARMQSAVLALGTGATTATLSYTAFNFDNTPGQIMADIVAGVLRIPETGWYLIGHYVTTIPTGGGGAPYHMSRLRRNSAPGTAWSVLSSEALVDPATNATHSQVNEIIRCDEGDTFTSEAFRIGTPGATGWTAEGRLYGIRVLGLGL